MDATGGMDAGAEADAGADSGADADSEHADISTACSEHRFQIHCE